MRQSNLKFSAIAFLAVVSFVFSACSSAAIPTTPGGGVKAEDAAASVNDKTIKMEDVERLIKQQGQGQEAKLSPLELAQARLQVLEGLIQQEVMYQKAEKENAVPKDEEVTAEFNKAKQTSGLSQEKFDEELKKAGQTEDSARETIKKRLAIQKLIENISSKVEPPKDAEVESFFNGNKEAYIKKKGVKLAAIVIDPAKNGEGDTTVDEQSAVLKGNEIIKQLQQGADFATLARDNSEDPQSRLQGGDLGYVSEDDLKQNFPPQVAATLMNPQFKVGQILPTPVQGKFYILKLQERSDREEVRTLDSPGVREDATNRLIEARKQLLAASYQAMAMNEAKIENYLAKQVVDNPNSLSGARPAVAETPADANANVNANVNSNVSTNANANANAKPVVNINTAKPPAAKTKK
ncbi:MAG: SurA N-terminal domain-containing protein [Pyrinomonadaceae bacterium]